ncbi:MAG: hypothetical protein L3J93_03300, partial [Thermoplasmata archaeon]|nr:hypothetical protein [Thermoplasmata archaeon]
MRLSLLVVLLALGFVGSGVAAGFTGLSALPNHELATAPGTHGLQPTLLQPAGGLLVPSLSLSASSATASQTIAITGSGFPASSPIGFSWDGAAAACANHIDATNGAGVASCLVVVPVATAGMHLIAAHDGFGDRAKAEFQVVPGITLSTVTAHAGDSVLVSG